MFKNSKPLGFLMFFSMFFQPPNLRPVSLAQGAESPPNICTLGRATALHLGHKGMTLEKNEPNGLWNGFFLSKTYLGKPNEHFLYNKHIWNDCLTTSVVDMMCHYPVFSDKTCWFSSLSHNYFPGVLSRHPLHPMGGPLRQGQIVGRLADQIGERWVKVNYHLVIKHG